MYLLGNSNKNNNKIKNVSCFPLRAAATMASAMGRCGAAGLRERMRNRKEKVGATRVK